MVRTKWDSAKTHLCALSGDFAFCCGVRVVATVLNWLPALRRLMRLGQPQLLRPLRSSRENDLALLLSVLQKILPTKLKKKLKYFVEKNSRETRQKQPNSNH
jgi:hypothetical protein